MVSAANYNQFCAAPLPVFGINLLVPGSNGSDQ